ncbi:MAG TPA: T9SS type A sorting domain-containing protein [Crocinitomicaceae bacterium]|nr:T9SS type A sorting domain-containing protein [Crocinitomicaceae bacterium]
MTKTITLLFIITLLFCSKSIAQPVHTQDFKGLWVTGFKANVLGNTQAEDSLLSYAQTHDFNYLICTNMFQILTSSCSPFTADMIALQSFINKAHTTYGIQYISGNVGSSATAQKIKDYNECVGVLASEKFDMITYECEFYNAGTNGSCLDFASYISQLSTIKNICETTTASNGIDSLVCEAYIGGSGSTGAIITNSSQAEMIQVRNNCDHVLLTYYRTTPSSSNGNFFNWTIQRLQWLAYVEGGPTEIVLLLKSRNTDGNNMHDYLQNYAGTHTAALKDPYFSWIEGIAYNPSLTPGYIERFTDGTYPWLNGIKVVGYTWFEHLANIEINDSVTLGGIELDNDFINIYPNPSSGEVNIKLNTLQEKLNVRLIDVTGRTVRERKIKLVQKFYLEKGVYFIQILNEKNEILSNDKFIIN